MSLMFPFPRLLTAVASTLVFLSSPSGAQSPGPATTPEAPPPKPAAEAAAEKPESARTGRDAGGKSKRSKEKKEKTTSGFDPKSFLLKLILSADDDGDGALSADEFRRIPLLKELKKERVDSLFADIDTDSNASLDTGEISKGFGKITDLAKEKQADPDDADAARQAKKLKRLMP